MKYITVIFLTTLLLVTASHVFCQHDFSRMQLQPDAHAIGLGGSGAALTFDPSAIYWNPANIAFLTRDRIFINITDSLFFNYFAFTKFFPPSMSLGLSFCQPRGIAFGKEFVTLALAYRAAPYLSLGSNFNVFRSGDNELYTSFGIGIFLQSFPAYRTTYTSSPSLGERLTAKDMKEKIKLSIFFHNIPINQVSADYQLRAALALKPVDIGPLFHFAYHVSKDTFSYHTGIQIPFFKGTDFYFGLQDLNPDEFAAGASAQLGHFQFDVSYRAKNSRINASVLIRLSEEETTLIQKYKSRGTEYVKQERLNAALHEYRKALSFQPDDDELNYLVSVLHKEVTDKSQKLDSLFAKASYYEHKGWFIYAYNYLQQIITIDLHNSKARRQLKKLMPELNKHLDTLVRQGIADYHQNDLPRARKIFQQVISINNNHPGALAYLAKIDSISSNQANEFYYRGLGYYKQGKLARASQEFKEALNFNPAHKPAQDYLQTVERELEANRRRIEKLLSDAKNYEDKKLYFKAAASYRKVLEIDLNHELARKKISSLSSYIKTTIDEKFQRARNLYNRGDYAGAIAELREILTIDPDHAAARNYLNRATQRLESLAQQHFLRAQNYYQQRDWDKVIQECNLTLAMNPSHNGAEELKKTALQNISLDQLIERGIHYFQKKDYQNAKAIFRQILLKEPGNDAATNYLTSIERELSNQITELFNLGLQYFTDGYYEEAIREWNNVLRIDSNHKSTLEFLQKARERLKALNEIQ